MYSKGWVYKREIVGKSKKRICCSSRNEVKVIYVKLYKFAKNEHIIKRKKKRKFTKNVSLRGKQMKRYRKKEMEPMAASDNDELVDS